MKVSNCVRTDVISASNQEKKSSILSAISLNASRDRMTELFKDFQKLNKSLESSIIETKTVGAKQSKSMQTDESNTTANGSLSNESFDMLKVTTTKPGKLTALYVGDLDESVTEELLYNYFQDFPSLSSVKICYAPGSKNSLGYGFVNFEDEKSAKDAIDTLNYTFLQGKEIRIMKSFQGKEKKFLGTNVFISNLNTDNNLTLRSFYEKFKSFGEILSCKVDLKKRQGFISFTDRSTAVKFVETMNNNVVDESRIFCSIHIPKCEREYVDSAKKNDVLITKRASSTSPSFTTPDSLNKTKVSTSTSASNTVIHSSSDLKGHQSSTLSMNTAPSCVEINSSLTSGHPFKQVYVKGLPLDITETDILKLFSSCGKIVEVFKESVERYKSSWSLITYESPDSAITAVDTFHKSIYHGKRLTCVKALKKADREIQVKTHELERANSSFNRLNELERANSSLNRLNRLKSLTNVPSDLRLTNSTTANFKLYIHNLPEGMNENFFKYFLSNYTFEGKILKYSINLPHSHEPSYIEFQKEIDARAVYARLNGVNIADHGLVVSLPKRLCSQHASTISKEDHNRAVSADASAVSADASDTSRRGPTLTRTNSKFFLPTETHHPMVHFQPDPIARYQPNHQQPNVDRDALQFVPVSSKGYDYRVVSDASVVRRRPSVKAERKTTRESVTERLQEASLQFIDFLSFPAATRSANLRRVLQYLIDTYWQNNLDEVNYTLLNLEDETIKNEFKSQLIGTIKLFGFERS